MEFVFKTRSLASELRGTSDKNSICLNHLHGGIDTEHTSHSFFTSVFIQVMEHRR